MTLNISTENELDKFKVLLAFRTQDKKDEKTEYLAHLVTVGALRDSFIQPALRTIKENTFN